MPALTPLQAAAVPAAATASARAVHGQVSVPLGPDEPAQFSDAMRRILRQLQRERPAADADQGPSRSDQASPAR